MGPYLNSTSNSQVIERRRTDQVSTNKDYFSGFKGSALGVGRLLRRHMHGLTSQTHIPELIDLLLSLFKRLEINIEYFR